MPEYLILNIAIDISFSFFTSGLSLYVDKCQHICKGLFINQLNKEKEMNIEELVEYINRITPSHLVRFVSEQAKTAAAIA